MMHERTNERDIFFVDHFWTKLLCSFGFENTHGRKQQHAQKRPTPHHPTTRPGEQICARRTRAQRHARYNDDDDDDDFHRLTSTFFDASNQKNTKEREKKGGEEEDDELEIL